ncbi:MAG: glycosyltransferase family 2 protein [Chitinophagaceae bacterium]|nr:glycosyltransferase family 2 protein [Chitinophagaceae bacterium]
MSKYVAIVITPVKNSIETALLTARAVAASDIKVHHIIFDDFSDDTTLQALQHNQIEIGYELILLSQLTSNPSPNYKLVLEIAQLRAVAAALPLLIVESDVVIQKDTISNMLHALQRHPFAGMIGAVTVDEEGKINFPYVKFRDLKGNIAKTDRSLSFCCTLISYRFMTSFDFRNLDSGKNWYDVFISRKSIEVGFENYILLDSKVLHKPHSSRSWKHLKYKNPLQYYFLKYWKGLDKI